MLRSPQFRYFYLPWAAGVCIIIVVALAPHFRQDADSAFATGGRTPLALPYCHGGDAVRVAPRFPGCPDDKVADSCANRLLENYLYGNTAYPADPANQGTAGLAVVQLDISASGAMTKIHLLRDPGHGRGADALRVVRRMRSEGILWRPATVSGRAVRQSVNLKIRYSNFRWAR